MPINQVIGLIHHVHTITAMPSLCELCKIGSGINEMETFVGDQSGATWQEIADAQAQGEFTPRDAKRICDDCVGTILTEIHGPSREGLAMLARRYVTFTIASIFTVGTGMPRVGMVPGRVPAATIYRSLIIGHVLDLGGAAL